MADEYLNIDFVFRNGLKDYEAHPPEEVWIALKGKVAAGKRKNTRQIYGMAAAVAVLLASAVTLTWVIQSGLSGETISEPALTMTQENLPLDTFNEPLPAVAANISNPEVIAAVPAKATAGHIQQPESEKLQEAEMKEFGYDIAGDDPVQPAMIFLSGLTPITGIEKEAREKKEYILSDLNNETRRSGDEKWKLGAAFLPSYYSKFSFGAGNAAADYIREENPAFSYSGGLSVSLGISRRFSLQTGLALNNMGQRVEGVNSFSGFIGYTETKSGSDFAIRTSSGTINSYNKDIYFLDATDISRVLTLYNLDVFDPTKADLKFVSSSIMQSIRYLELPVVMRYKVVDRNFDISMAGGISYNILVGNTSYIQSDGVKYTIGKTSGLNPVTLSSSVGIGLEYNLFSGMTFSLEPMFRYYITPLDGVTGSGIHPYSFGVLSGFFYNF